MPFPGVLLRGALLPGALLLGVLLSGCGAEAGSELRDAALPEAEVEAAPKAPEAPEAEEPTAVPDELPPLAFERPEAIRGIYLNAWASGSLQRSTELIELARRTEVNTFVIDVKDASGFVSYPTRVQLAREIGADGEVRIRDARELLERLEAEGIWPIARIVVFKDPILAEVRPEMAVRDSTGAPWIDGKGHRWVNPWDERVWAYHVELAREAVALGFQEIQWDYVRFPDRPDSEMAHARFPGDEGRARSQAIRAFLAYSRGELEELGVPLTADVFGVTTSFRRDVGIGQLWEDFIDLVDAALPMVYPSHYWVGGFGFDAPNLHPYEVVHAALGDALRRNDGLPRAGRVIPWLQDFTLGEPRYEVPEVRAQILATHDLGLSEWILWNASSRYTEGALEPVGGWPDGMEPPIRWGGGVVSAEERLRAPVTEVEPTPGG